MIRSGDWGILRVLPNPSSNSISGTTLKRL
jgi:hypothetical protein